MNPPARYLVCVVAGALAGFAVAWVARMPIAEAPAFPVTSSAPTPTPSVATQAAFERIYENSEWGENDAGLGTSGSGSTVEATAVYRAFLTQFMRDNDIHSVVDAGCGDWEFSQTIDWSGIHYKGFDIVPAVIARDKAQFGKPNIEFFHADIVKTELPEADLLLSKHVLQHLPSADIKTFLAQLPKFKHALITNGVSPRTFSARNVDIQAGAYRELDITQPPFGVAGSKVLSYWDGHHMHQVVHVRRK
ncbi:MAG: class I SAM-dependent methyltransferase [Labilithrix sp.]|nr:class I SAM-dependent methyltransferase [Labilithrix sp.]MCW5817208.1 class I SAM-dependent methyltransferase [Labilithrix sp.]